MLLNSIYAALEQKVSVIKVHPFLITRLGNENITQQHFKKLVCWGLPNLSDWSELLKAVKWLILVSKRWFCHLY